MAIRKAIPIISSSLVEHRIPSNRSYYDTIMFVTVVSWGGRTQRIVRVQSNWQYRRLHLSYWIKDPTTTVIRCKFVKRKKRKGVVKHVPRRFTFEDQQEAFLNRPQLDMSILEGLL